MPENPRQEIEFDLDGKTFRVRPTFEVIANVEAALSQSARSLGLKALAAGMSSVERGTQTEITLSEFCVVLYWILRGKPDAPASAKAIGEILMEAGYGALLLPVGLFLTRAQRGNKEHEKEAVEKQEVAGVAIVDPPNG